ncbi:MAG: hypothetical protein CL988_01305 [Euryarchaeota archaeon]|nr:hypothetical protein [Euryarchaeota archaeon]
MSFFEKGNFPQYDSKKRFPTSITSQLFATFNQPIALPLYPLGTGYVCRGERGAKSNALRPKITSKITLFFWHNSAQ